MLAENDKYTSLWNTIVLAVYTRTRQYILVCLMIVPNDLRVSSRSLHGISNGKTPVGPLSSTTRAHVQPSLDFFILISFSFLRALSVPDHSLPCIYGAFLAKSAGL